MAGTYSFVEGWTLPITRNLTKDGAGWDATGADAPELIMVNVATGRRVDTTGDVAWVDTTVPKLKYTPDPGDLKPGRYRVTFRLTETGGDSFFPNGDPEIWVVRPA